MFIRHFDNVAVREQAGLAASFPALTTVPHCLVLHLVLHHKVVVFHDDFRIFFTAQHVDEAWN